MARPSPGIPLQIKICLHSFVFFCDDIGSLTFNRGRDTKWRGANTHNDGRGKISDAQESGVTLCCVAFFIHFPPQPHVYCHVGPKWAGRAQAMVHGAPWAGLCRVPGLAQSWQRGEWRHSDTGEMEHRHEHRNIVNTVTLGDKNRGEYSREWYSDNRRISSSPVRNLQLPGDLLTGGQPECDNGKQSQHQEPTLVRPAPDLWNCGLKFL